MKKLIQIFILTMMLFLLACSSTTIDDKVIDITKVDTSRATMYQQDFVYLVKKIKEIHPVFAINDYKNIDIKEFDKLAYDIYKYLGKNDDNFNNYKFCLYATQILAKLNDGHALFPFLKDPYPNERTLPIMMYWFGDELFIINTTEEYSSLLNKRIIKIANVDVLDVRNMANAFISGDNIYSKKTENALLLGKEMLLQWLGLIENDSVKIEYLDNGEEKTIYLPISEFYTYYTIDFRYKAKEIGRNDMTNDISQKLWFQYLSKYNAMYLKVNLFNNEYYYFDYVGEYKKIFSSIKENNVKYLIIDLRDCIGGNSYIGFQLLSYLKNKQNDNIYFYKYFYRISKEAEDYHNTFDIEDEDYDFNELGSTLVQKSLGIIYLPTHYAFNKDLNENYMPYPDEDNQYDGEVYVLCGNDSFSLASIFSAIIKDNSYGIVIGEPTASASVSHTSGLSIRLSRTMLNVYIPAFLIVRMKGDARLAEPDAVYPDIYIPTTFEDYINGKDPCWEYLVENVFSKQED